MNTIKRKRTAIGPVIIVLGPQGSGKGTQAERIAERFHFVHLDFGRMLRDIAHSKRQTAFTKKVAALINPGKLVPFEWVITLLHGKLRAIPKQKGIILDGSPRKLSEAKALVAALRKDTGRTVTKVFFLDIPKAESIRRLSKRYVCLGKRHTLTMGKDIRKPNDRCPLCKSAIMQREDDKPKAIAKRLSIYTRETMPVVKFFDKQGILVRIDGRQSIGAVSKNIVRILRSEKIV